MCKIIISIDFESEPSWCLNMYGSREKLFFLLCMFDFRSCRAVSSVSLWRSPGDNYRWLLRVGFPSRWMKWIHSKVYQRKCFRALRCFLDGIQMISCYFYPIWIYKYNGITRDEAISVMMILTESSICMKITFRARLKLAVNIHSASSVDNFSLIKRILFSLQLSNNEIPTSKIRKRFVTNEEALVQQLNGLKRTSK